MKAGNGSLEEKKRGSPSLVSLNSEFQDHNGFSFVAVHCNSHAICVLSLFVVFY